MFVFNGLNSGGGIENVHLRHQFGLHKHVGMPPSFNNGTQKLQCQNTAMHMHERKEMKIYQ